MATTIEQSRELMKYLPLETADMGYPEGGTIPFPLIRPLKEYDNNIIPAWSLDTLLNIMPEIKLIKYENDEPGKEGTYLYRLVWKRSFLSSKLDDMKLTDVYEKPIDAAVEMIK